MIEKDIENKIKKTLTSLKIYYFKSHGGIFSCKGIPDLIVNYKGYFFVIEVKCRPNKLTTHQLNHLKKIYEKSKYVFVIDDFTVDEFLNALRNDNEKELIWISKKMLKHYKVIG